MNVDLERAPAHVEQIASELHPRVMDRALSNTTSPASPRRFTISARFHSSVCAATLSSAFAATAESAFGLRGGGASL